ncbi:MAG TPA: ferritin family protein [Candidatus Kapabacteria bacterium]|nr:ferritin family protein [Candidatus Kapabacteria bacterium]
MNIYEFAMKMEMDGEAYYRELASKTKIPALQKILGMLADDEVAHYNIVKRIRENLPAELAETKVLTNAKNIFAQLKDQENDFNLDGSEVGLYKKAVEIENKSENFYKEKAGETETPEAKELLLKIAAQERNHGLLVENMIVFLLRPQLWVENGEFNHLDQY